MNLNIPTEDRATIHAIQEMLPYPLQEMCRIHLHVGQIQNLNSGPIV